MAYLFLNKREPFNPAFKILKPESCPVEMQIRKRISRYAMEWLTIGVDCRNSLASNYHTRTRLIVDLHNHPDISAHATISNENTIHPWFDTTDALQILMENGLRVEGYKIIGYPAYMRNGQRATLLTSHGDTTEIINGRKQDGCFLQWEDGDTTHALQIFEQLCRYGEVKFEDSKSIRTVYRVRNLIYKATKHSNATNISVESVNERHWKLIDPSTGRQTTLAFLLLFPIERKS